MRNYMFIIIRYHGPHRKLETNYKQGDWEPYFTENWKNSTWSQIQPANVYMKTHVLPEMRIWLQALPNPVSETETSLCITNILQFHICIWWYTVVRSNTATEMWQLFQVKEPQATEWNIPVWWVDRKLTQHNTPMKISLPVHGRFAQITVHAFLCIHL